MTLRTYHISLILSLIVMMNACGKRAITTVNKTDFAKTEATSESVQGGNEKAQDTCGASLSISDVLPASLPVMDATRLPIQIPKVATVDYPGYKNILVLCQMGSPDFSDYCKIRVLDKSGQQIAEVDSYSGFEEISLKPVSGLLRVETSACLVSQRRRGKAECGEKQVRRISLSEAVEDNDVATIHSLITDNEQERSRLCQELSEKAGNFLLSLKNTKSSDPSAEVLQGFARYIIENPKRFGEICGQNILQSVLTEQQNVLRESAALNLAQSSGGCQGGAALRLSQTQEKEAYNNYFSEDLSTTNWFELSKRNKGSSLLMGTIGFASLTSLGEDEATGLSLTDGDVGGAAVATEGSAVAEPEAGKQVNAEQNAQENSEAKNKAVQEADTDETSERSKSAGDSEEKRKQIADDTEDPKKKALLEPDSDKDKPKQQVADSEADQSRTADEASDKQTKADAGEAETDKPKAADAGETKAQQQHSRQPKEDLKNGVENGKQSFDPRAEPGDSPRAVADSPAPTKPGVIDPRSPTVARSAAPGVDVTRTKKGFSKGKFAGVAGLVLVATAYVSATIAATSHLTEPSCHSFKDPVQAFFCETGETEDRLASLLEEYVILIRLRDQVLTEAFSQAETKKP